MIKNIIWDWNGTIVNDASVFVVVMNTVLSRRGLKKISLSDYKQNFCFPIKKYWRFLGFKFNDSSFDKMNKEFINLYKRKMLTPSLHSGIVDVLKLFKQVGLSQFVLSASESSLLKESVAHYNIRSYFLDVWGVNNLNALGKESLALDLIKEYGLDPKETLLIGDTEYDLSVALAVGCRVLLVSFGHFHKSRLVCLDSVVVDSPSKIPLFVFS